jgi:hypothetical protein
MKTGLREYIDMKERLEQLEESDELNLLILQHAGSARDEIQIVDLLQTAFATHITEHELPTHKMAELNAKMTSYIEAVVEDPELTEETCLYWFELNR